MAWWAAFGILTALALALIWLPISRIGAHYQINYNEGWNAYLQRAAAEGGHIYGAPPAHVYANYPPLSFYLVGLLGRLVSDVNLAGRWVSLLSFFALMILSGLTVRRLTGSRRCGALTALLVVIFIAALKPDRIGMNDPHLLGMAFVAFGFYAYVRSAGSDLWLRISAVAFVAGLYTKQTLLAFPLAVAIHLLLADKQRFRTWLAAGAAAGFALLAFTFGIGGSHFLEHLMLPRAYTYAGFLLNTVWYLLFFQTAILAALVWCFGARLAGNNGLLVWAFALTHVLAFWFVAGGGGDMNHLFDPIVALAMIAGLAVPYAVWISEKVRWRSTLLGILLTLPFCLGVLTMLPTHIAEDVATRQSIPQAEQDFASAVEFVRSQAGPALCENLLACYEAGKPEEYDVFVMDQIVKSGKAPESAILRLFDQKHFSVVQLDIAADEPIAPAPRLRTSAAFMSGLLKNYKVAMRSGGFTLFTPK